MSAGPHAEPSRIGVFDSGVGGLSILDAARRRVPGAAWLYVADAGHAPYGERDADHVIERARCITAHLVEHGATTIVVACNTATALAIDALRSSWSALRFVGVEPAIKPAAAASRERRIGVLATPATLASERFRALVQRHGADAMFELQPCPGLATAIETAGADMLPLLERFCASLRAARVDGVVLGCTHYHFVRDDVQRLLGPDVVVIDTAQPVAERIAALCGSASGAPCGAVQLQTTGDTEALQRFARRWLEMDAPVSSVSI